MENDIAIIRDVLRFYADNWTEQEILSYLEPCPTVELCNDCGAKAKQAIAALDRIEKKNVIQEGWKLVPIEPTEEMINVFHLVSVEATLSENVKGKNRPSYKGYKAMIEAAPQPPKKGGT